MSDSKLDTSKCEAGLRVGSGSGESKWWRASWYGKKAMAVYAMVGLAIAATSIAIAPRQSPNGNDLLNQNGQDSTAVHAVDTSDPPKERVLVGETVAELRLNGDVRALRYEEQTMPLSKASGVWGVGLARVIESNTSAGDTLMDGVTLQNDPERWRGVVEIHKTVEGKVRVVGFVEKGSVARLLDESRAVGRVYLYHKPVREGLVPVAIPASRVVSWDYREPHEFSEIVID